MKIDKYQKRYLEHQKRKKKIIQGKPDKKYSEKHHYYSGKEIFGIVKAMFSRRSQRIFNDRKICPKIKIVLDKAVIHAPSSCNRQAIHIQKIDPKNDNVSLLVGGVSWAEKAKMILFLYADMNAYKSPNEVDFMCYLDAGFVGQNIYLICEAIGLGCCYINPNLKIKGQLDRNNYKFMGAMALGYYEKKAIIPPKRKTAWKKIIV